MKTSGKRTNHPVTVADVAREAGCSSGVVSFVMHKNHPVSAETRERVHSAIEKLGYRPYAKTVRHKPKTVFFITAHPVSNEYIKTLQELLEARGYLMQCVFLQSDLANMEKYLAAINSNKDAAGIICMHPFIESFDLLRGCKRVPSVIYSRTGSMLSHATLKYELCGELAVEHFRLHGHRKAAMLILKNPKRSSWPWSRGFQKADGLSTEVITMARDRISEKTLAPVLKKLLARGVKALLVANEEFLQPLQMWAYHTRRTYPEDFSLILFDFNNTADGLLPPVTAVEFPSDQMLALTVDELLAKVNGSAEPAERELLPYLIDRGSVGGGKQNGKAVLSFVPPPLSAGKTG